MQTKLNSDMVKFRIVGSDVILAHRMTDSGTIVLVPIDFDGHYIDDYFHNLNEVPELEFSVVDGEWLSFSYIKDWGVDG